MSGSFCRATVQRRDPFYSAGALHFDNMFVRYGVPIIVLNLVKVPLGATVRSGPAQAPPPLIGLAVDVLARVLQQKEKTPRESLLLHEYTAMIAYLNQFLPREMRIRYIAWDMARAAKRSGSQSAPSTGRNDHRDLGPHWEGVPARILLRPRLPAV